LGSTYLGGGTLGLKGWEVGINPVCEGGGFEGKKQKQSHGGSIFANKLQRGSYSGGGDLYWVGESQIERVGMPD